MGSSLSWGNSFGKAWGTSFGLGDAVTLTPARYDNVNIFYLPLVTQPQELVQDARFNNTNAFYTPLIAAPVLPPLLVNANQFYAARVRKGSPAPTFTLDPTAINSSFSPNIFVPVPDWYPALGTLGSNFTPTAGAAGTSFTRTAGVTGSSFSTNTSAPTPNWSPALGISGTNFTPVVGVTDSDFTPIAAAINSDFTSTQITASVV